jgi:hypothetical protein
MGPVEFDDALGEMLVTMLPLSVSASEAAQTVAIDPHGARELRDAVEGPESGRRPELGLLTIAPAHAGLSEVSVADIEAARRVFPVATVQNR